MFIVENRNHKPEPDHAHARTLLPNFRGSRCPNAWLTGEYAIDTAQKIVDAANEAGLGVQGEPKITLFGISHDEKARSGPTIEIVLKASGFAIDFWPLGCFTLNAHGVEDKVYGVGLANLDWCNRDELYNRQAIRFLRILATDILQIEHLDFSKSGKRRPINTTGYVVVSKSGRRRIVSTA